MLKDPKKRLRTFVFAQATGLFGDSCDILSYELQRDAVIVPLFAYVAISTAIIFGTLRYYDRLLINA